MSDCAHAIKPFDTYYLQDEFVSGPFCPYCRIQQLESMVYDAYELGQEDGRKIDGGPYKDVKEVFAALGETDNE